MENWFTKRRKSKVLELAERQLTLAIDTVTELKRAITATSQREIKKAKKSIERLFLIEVEIDDLRRAVFEESTKGSLPPNDREDLLHLVKRLDVTADHVKDSARNVLILTEADIPQELWDAYVSIAEDLVDCAAALRKTIEMLGVNTSEAKKLTEKVDKIEGRIDEKYIETKMKLLKYSRKVDPAALLILKDLLDFMENVADSCDDTADYVRILAVSREKT